MNFKKVLALVLVVAMCLSMIPTYAFAEDVELWDEEEVAVQDDAALEDVYLDEEPEEVIVEDEPEATEPEAVEVEEPAAEEPAAAEEPVAAVAEAVAVEETNDFAAADTVAMVMSNGRMCASFAEAVSVASNTDIIVMMQNDTLSTPVTIQKKLTVYPGLASASIAARLIVSGELTLENMTTTAIDVTTGGKLTIAKDDTGSYGTVSDARGGATTGFISGGTFTSLSKTLLASNAFAPTVIDENTVSGKVQIAVARVVEKKAGADYTKDGTAYGTLAEAVTEALRAETGKTKVLVILSSPAATDKIELKAGETLNIYSAAGVTLPNEFVTAATNCYFDPASPSAVEGITTYNCKAYAAMWHKGDGTSTQGIKKAKNFINYNCIYGDGYVEFFVKPESKVTLKAPDATHKTVKVTVVDNEFAPDIAAPDNYALDIDNTTVPGKIVYTVVDAVASYQKPKTAGSTETETTYTATFNEAATKAAELATDHQFAVKLYKAPAIEGTTKDTYTMTEAGVLTVTNATNTDILANYDKFVVGGSGVSVTASKAGNTATYTATAAKARIDIPNAEPEYYPSFQAAAQSITSTSANYEARKDLIITPLVDDTWEIGPTWKPYPIKVNDSNATITENAGNRPVVVDKDPATGYTLYTVIDATASYVDADDKPVFTDSFKAAAEGAEKVAADKATDPTQTLEYAVNLYQIPTVLGDVFEMSAGKLTVATQTDVTTDWTKWNKAAAKKLVKEAAGNVIAVNMVSAGAEYTVTEAVARIGDDLYYDDLLKAIVDFVNEETDDQTPIPAGSVITVLKTASAEIDGTSSQAGQFKDEVLRIAKENASDTVTITYKNGTNEHYTVKEKPVDGYSEYSLVEAVASYEKKINSTTTETVYTETFKEAADSALAQITKTKKNYSVKLYAIPEEGDTHAISLNSTLTVVAEPTSLANWNEDAAKKLVVPNGETAIIVNFADGTATYTTAEPVAKAKLNQVDPSVPEFEYYADLATAFKTVFEDNNNDKLYLVPLKSDTFEITSKTQLATYTNLKVRIDNSDPEKIIKLKDYKDGEGENVVRYAWAREDGTEYSTYTLNRAVVSIPMTAELDKYFTPQDNENVKYFGTFRQAIEADKDAVVTLLEPYTYEDESHETQTYKETFQLGALGGVSSVKVKEGNYKWLSFEAVGDNAVVHAPDVTDKTVTIYSLDDTPVASITEGTGDAAKTTYYSTFDEAAKAGAAGSLADAKTIKLLAPITADYALGYNEFLKVEKGNNALEVIVNPSDMTNHPYYINKVEGTVTTYSPVVYEASIGDGDLLQYKETFAEAVTAAADTDAVITIYKDVSYKLGEGSNATKLVIYANGHTPNITAVDPKAVSKTSETVDRRIIDTYEITDPVAKVNFGSATSPSFKYYATFGEAVNATKETVSESAKPETIILLSSVTETYKLGLDNEKPVMIKVQKDGNTVEIECNDAAKTAGYAIKETVADGVTTYTQVKAVASITTGTGEDAETVLYATVGGEKGAIAAAFAPKGTEPEKTVVILENAVLDADDIFEAPGAGAFLVDISEQIAKGKNPEIYEKHVKAAKDEYFDYEPVAGKSDTYKIFFYSAVAKVLKNDGKTYGFFGELNKAIAVSSERNPVVLLENNTYMLATGTDVKNPIFVNKNGFEFTVTKVDPDKVLPKVAIVSEELTDGITKYEAVEDVAAYINFTTEQPKSGSEYEYETVDNYVYYVLFTDAVKAAENGKHVIHLTRPMEKSASSAVDETYYLSSVDEILKVATHTNLARIDAVEGLKLNENAATDDETVTVYTATKAVASVTAVFSGDEVTTKPYDNLPEAIAYAVAHYADDTPAVLTLYEKPAEDFVFGFNKLDKLLVAQDEDYGFELSNFTSPEGTFVTKGTHKAVSGIEVDEYGVGKGIASVTANEDGKNVEYVYATFAEAVDKVIEIENAKAYNDETKDEKNPDTVINLWADNPTAYSFFANLKSLMIADNGFNANLQPSSGNFVEKLGTDLLGVTLYRDVLAVAEINFSPAWATVNDKDVWNVKKYGSFAAAAADAFNTEFTVELLAEPDKLPDSDDRDVFEMAIGTLKVDGKNNVTDLRKFIDFDPKAATIIPVGENASLSFMPDTDGDNSKGTFTVDGSVAMIKYPGISTPRYFKTFLDALRVQAGTKLVITPLTNIDCYFVATPTDSNKQPIMSYTVDESVNYKVNVTLEGYETVADADDATTTTSVEGKYNFVKGKFYIVSDTVDHYDSTTYEPIYRFDYYADLGSASFDANNTAVIHALENPGAYELGKKDVNEVLKIKYEYPSPSWEPTPGQTGYDWTWTYDETTGAYTYSLVAAQKLIVKVGDGGAWPGVTDPELKVKDKEYLDKAGDSLTAFVTAEANKQPVKEGYSIKYYQGNDGYNYVWATSTDVMTQEEIKAGYKPLTVMPENGLELTAIYEANQYWVVFRSETYTPSRDKWVKFTYDGLVQAPAPAPTKRGNAFQGWYLLKDTNHENAFDFANTKFANTEKDTLIDHVDVPAASETGLDSEGKMILVAYFTPEDYTVTFDSTVGVEIKPATVKGGNGVNRPTFAADTKWQRTGYNDFDPAKDEWGYFNEKNEWVKFSFIGDDKPTSVYGNMTLIPKWVAKNIVLVWADGSYVLQEDAGKPVGTATDAPKLENLNRTNPGYRIDPKKAWIDDEGDLFDGTVPAKEVGGNGKWIYRLNWIKQIPVSFFYDGDVIATIDVDENSTLAENPNVPKPEDKTKAYAWTLKGEDYDLTTPVTEKITLVGTLVDAEPEEDYSDYASVVSALDLVDNINIHAYVTIKEDTDPSDYEVLIDFNGKTTKEGTLDQIATFDGSEYKIENIAVVAAPQMNDPAIVNITYKGNDVVVDEELSVRGYAEKWIERDSVPGLKNVLIALLDYGAYSQLQFNYQTDNLVNTTYHSGNVESTSVPESYPVTVEGSVTGIGDPSIALTLVSDTTMNMYFSAAKKASFQFKIDGKEAEATYANKEYKVALPKIRVADLDVKHTFTVTRGNATMSVTAAPLAYAFQHQNDTGALGNVCKAVYLYYQAADAYFG